MFWNVIGLSAPLLVAVLTIPELLSRVGQERFGFLTLTWGLIGYASALDLGIGRALTRYVSDSRGSGQLHRIAPAMTSALGVTVSTGLLAATMFAILSLIIEPSWFSATSVSRSELRFSVLLLAIALPAQAISAMFRGTNEALLNFKGINLLRIGLGIVSFGGPYVVSSFTITLPWLVSTIVASRVFALAIYRALARARLRDLLPSPRSHQFDRGLAVDLLRFGGWVTLSGIISPFMLQADRFFIAAFLGLSIVPTYVVPYEVVIQSLIIVGAVTSVAFPVLASSMSDGSSNWRHQFNRWLIRVAIVMGFVCTGMALLLPAALTIWLGDALNPLSVTVGQVLTIGVFANSIGSMFYAQLHARGRAKSTALLHAVELPLLLGAMLWAIPTFGVVGAAWVWVGRATADTAALALMAKQHDA